MKKYTLSILSLLSVHYVSQVRCSEYDRRADATSSFNRAVEDSNSKRRDAINEWFDRFSCTQDGAPVKDPIEVPEHVRKLASDDNKVVGVTNADPEKSEYASSELTGHIFAFKTGKSSLQMVLMALPGGLYTLEVKNNALHAVRRYDFSQEKAFITLLNKGFIQPVPRKKLTVCFLLKHLHHQHSQFLLNFLTLAERLRSRLLLQARWVLRTRVCHS